LKVVGFSEVAKVRHFKLHDSLITSLVESWWSETHIFNLPIVECIVTLEDVALQQSLKVDKKVVSGPTMYDWKETCFELLGSMCD